MKPLFDAKVNIWTRKPWDGDSRYELAGWERKLRTLNRKARENRQLVEAGNIVGVQVKHERPRVLINPECDIFENWIGPVYASSNGKPVEVSRSLDDIRMRLFRVAEECDELDLLLVTKKPENVLRMAPKPWTHAFVGTYGGQPRFLDPPAWPFHVWLVATVENQSRANECIPELLKVPAKVRGLNLDPILGPIRLPWLHNCTIVCGQGHTLTEQIRSTQKIPEISWVIVGGESGQLARSTDIDWIRSVVEQCQCARVPVFVKQLGYHVIANSSKDAEWLLEKHICGRKSDRPEDWPVDLRVQEFPELENTQ